MIKFEQGSGTYVSGAEIFLFNAADERGRVTGAISQEAFEDLTGERVRAATAEQQFSTWEAVVFKLAEEKFDREGRNASGGIAVNSADVAARRGE